jgi:hypothetical protein
MAHFLSPPFGLPGDGDARLLRHLADDDWVSAMTVLRDVVTSETTAWRWLVLLAYCRFRDASDVMPDELTDACREALGLLERALRCGAPVAEVAPFKEAVEETLDQLSRGEEALLARLGPDDDAGALSTEELENVAFLVQRAQPARAARLFTTLAERFGDAPQGLVAQARAALAWAQAGDFAAARPGLEAALARDWSEPPLNAERRTLEAVETALLERAEGDDFDAQWRLAEARGAALAFPFPAAWPHQERLFERCVQLRDFPRARALAQRMEDERAELPRALAQRLRAVWLEHV